MDKIKLEFEVTRQQARWLWFAIHLVLDDMPAKSDPHYKFLADICAKVESILAPKPRDYRKISSHGQDFKKS